MSEWREGTSKDITFSYNLAAEGLADSSHPKGEHSKGSLVHDNVTNILFYRNVFAHNVERSPLFKGGVHGSIVNNLIYDPGKRAVHYNLMALEWEDRPYEVGKMSAVGEWNAALMSHPRPQRPRPMQRWRYLFITPSVVTPARPGIRWRPILAIARLSSTSPSFNFNGR